MVGEAKDGDEAIVSVGQLKPAVVLMDVRMQKMDGVTAARLIKVQYPDRVVIGLSAEAKHYDVYAMQNAGAFEVLTKEQAMQDLYGAIQRAVAAFNRCLSWKKRLSRRIPPKIQTNQRSRLQRSRYR